MFTKAPSSTPRQPTSRLFSWRSMRDLAGDILGAISIFATGYILLLIGHGLGLN